MDRRGLATGGIEPFCPLCPKVEARAVHAASPSSSFVERRSWCCLRPRLGGLEVVVVRRGFSGRSCPDDESVREIR